MPTTTVPQARSKPAVKRDPERRSMGDRWFAMAYLNTFGDDIASIFSAEEIGRAVSGEVKPLFGAAGDHHREHAQGVQGSPTPVGRGTHVRLARVVPTARQGL
jgi:hypothetical protein